MTSCTICGHEVDADEVERRDTGAFHRACFDGLGSAAIGVKTCADDHTECRMCSQPIVKGAPIVEFFGINCVAHLRCFFGTANGRARSLGACAWRLSAADRGRALREQSGALLALSRRLRAAQTAGWRSARLAPKRIPSRPTA
jgi:hypothetical protein